MKRKQIAAANWKMNLTFSEAESLANELANGSYELNEQREVILAVPFPYLVSIQEILAHKGSMFVAAQNCSDKKQGAYTGETSVEMLKSIGVEYVIIGHSERREYFNEGNIILGEKINRCLESKVKPVFCCGETLAIRDANSQNDFVETQLRESLFHLPDSMIKDFIIAYEPIWAIGTGKTASSSQAQEMHAHIRSVLAAQYGEDIAETVSILYGGSVKATNAKELFSLPDVDGGLVGGASLIAAEFTTIISSLK